MNRPQVSRAVLRFIASGAFNTLVTYLVYLALLAVLPYRWSYTAAYALGIVLAYFLYRHFVFAREAVRYGPLWVALIYLLQYLLGLALVDVWVRLLHAPAVLAPAFAVLVSLPLTFLLNRRVFRGKTGNSDTLSRDE